MVPLPGSFKRPVLGALRGWAACQFLRACQRGGGVGGCLAVGPAVDLLGISWLTDSVRYRCGAWGRAETRLQELASDATIDPVPAWCVSTATSMRRRASCCREGPAYRDGVRSSAPCSLGVQAGAKRHGGGSWRPRPWLTMRPKQRHMPVARTEQDSSVMPLGNWIMTLGFAHRAPLDRRRRGARAMRASAPR